jgi:hypothetical protein
MAALSLRSRLLIGALLWTVGLFTIAGILVTQLIVSYPSAPRYFHHPFTMPHLSWPIAIVCMTVGFLQVRRGLTAVAQVRERLADVHAGRQTRLQGEYPAEMQPLVADLNALLAARNESVARAQAKAGDLAHGPQDAAGHPRPRSRPRERGRPCRGRLGHPAGTDAHAAANRLSPRPRPCVRIRCDARRARERAGNGRWSHQNHESRPR